MPGVPASAAGRRSRRPGWLSPAGWSTGDRRRRRRSIVNRVWQAYFGTGLVATSEDLGIAERAAVASGAARLAGRRVHGQRLEPEAPAPADRQLGDLSAIVARHARTAARRDPYNRLLARGPRFRVDAEIVRDIASGGQRAARTRRSAGRASIPPAPEFLFQPPASYGPKVWDEAKGPDRYRRALYTFRYRSVPYPMLQTFDAPNGDFACVRRTRSNTPLQALTTLNEPIFLECARALALRTLREGGCDDRIASNMPSAAAWRANRPPRKRPPPGPAPSGVRRFEQPGADPWALAAADPAQKPRVAPRTPHRPARRLDGRLSRAAQPR